MVSDYSGLIDYGNHMRSIARKNLKDKYPTYDEAIEALVTSESDNNSIKNELNIYKMRLQKKGRGRPKNIPFKHDENSIFSGAITPNSKKSGRPAKKSQKEMEDFINHIDKLLTSSNRTKNDRKIIELFVTDFYKKNALPTYRIARNVEELFNQFKYMRDKTGIRQRKRKADK